MSTYSLKRWNDGAKRGVTLGSKRARSHNYWGFLEKISNKPRSEMGGIRNEEGKQKCS